jgi:hypothetical protein
MLSTLWEELCTGGFWPSTELQEQLRSQLAGWLRTCFTCHGGIPLRAALMPKQARPWHTLHRPCKCFAFAHLVPLRLVPALTCMLSSCSRSVSTCTARPGAASRRLCGRFCLPSLAPCARGSILGYRCVTAHEELFWSLHARGCYAATHRHDAQSCAGRRLMRPLSSPRPRFIRAGRVCQARRQQVTRGVAARV